MASMPAEPSAHPGLTWPGKSVEAPKSARSLSDEELAAIADEWATAAGFEARPVSEGFEAESCLYELMRLKSFVLSRVEQLEEAVVSHTGNRVAPIVPQSSMGGPADDSQLQIASLKAALECLHTEVVVHREKNLHELEGCRQELDELKNHLVASNEAANASSPLPTFQRKGDSPLPTFERRQKMLPDSFNVLPRLEDMQREIAGLTSRQETVEMKTLRWETPASREIVLELSRQVEAETARINDIESQLGAVLSNMPSVCQRKYSSLTEGGLSSARSPQSSYSYNSAVVAGDSEARFAETRTNLSLLAEAQSKMQERVRLLERSIQGTVQPQPLVTENPRPDLSPVSRLRMSLEPATSAVATFVKEVVTAEEQAMKLDQEVPRSMPVASPRVPHLSGTPSRPAHARTPLRSPASSVEARFGRHASPSCSNDIPSEHSSSLLTTPAWSQPRGRSFGVPAEDTKNMHQQHLHSIRHSDDPAGSAKTTSPDGGHSSVGLPVAAVPLAQPLRHELNSALSSRASSNSQGALSSRASSLRHSIQHRGQLGTPRAANSMSPGRTGLQPSAGVHRVPQAVPRVAVQASRSAGALSSNSSLASARNQLH